MAASTSTETARVSRTELAKRYFKALDTHDLEAAGRCWAQSGVDRFVGQQEVVGPGGVKQYFRDLLAAFPDFSIQVLDATSARHRTAVRWRATGTFAGPANFQGLQPTGAQIQIEGCDVMTIEDELIQHGDSYFDSGDLARQLGVLPALGSGMEARLMRLTNLRSKLRNWRHGARTEWIAEGVWIVRGGFPAKVMNVYLIEEEGQVTVFDAGVAEMSVALRSAAARLGGVKRVVLGHADADHRGAAAGLDAPVYCHPEEREAAESADSFRPYWDLDKLDPHGRVWMPRVIPTWDGGALQVAGTVQEGDEIAGFRVIDLPGHAPGLIGLFRERDRLALVSDCFYTLDPQTGVKGPPRVPHSAFNLSTEQAAASIRKLAALEPAAAWAGHAEPVTGEVVEQLHQAATRTSP
jgi:glyoxylase-like metal-dependent hydrolase (beta-lactamase superfamily II)/predicted ester cyclase